MSTLTTFLKLIKPTRLEKYSVKVLNDNFDSVDAGVKKLDLSSFNIVTNNTGVGYDGNPPAGAKLTMFIGRMNVATGAGGNTRTATPATDANGHGGIWYGYNGVPPFKGVLFASLKDSGNTDALAGIYEIIDISGTRIRFRGLRQQLGNSNPYTNGYGGIFMNVMIIGWL